MTENETKFSDRSKPQQNGRTVANGYSTQVRNVKWFISLIKARLFNCCRSFITVAMQQMSFLDPLVVMKIHFRSEEKTLKVNCIRNEWTQFGTWTDLNAEDKKINADIMYLQGISIF